MRTRANPQTVFLIFSDAVRAGSTQPTPMKGFQIFEFSATQESAAEKQNFSIKMKNPFTPGDEYFILAM
jgi:hypothetical protein